MTTHPPPDDFPKYVGPTSSEEETLDLGGPQDPYAARRSTPTSGTRPTTGPRPATQSPSGPSQGRPGQGVPGQAAPEPNQPAGNGNGANRRIAAGVTQTQAWWQEKLHDLSLHARVTLLAAVAVGLAVAFVSVAAYATVRQQMYRNLDDSLEARATQAASKDVLTRLVNVENVPPDALGLSDIQLGVYTAGGARVGGDVLPPMEKPELSIAQPQATGDFSLRTVGIRGGPHYRVIAVHANFCSLKQAQFCTDADYNVPGALVVAQSLTPIDRTLHNLGIVLWAVGLLGVIGAALAGNAIAQSGLRPLARLTGEAERIARTEELKPIPVSGSDEISRLALAFNAMLTALARSQDRQRRLVGDAGHELRTPLTSIRTNLDLLAQADKKGGLKAEDRQQLLDDVRAQMDELTNLIGDLTELARDTPQVRNAELIELQNVVEDAVIKVRRRAQSLEWDVQLEPFPVWGDERLLGRAVTNLLDNAAKYSTPDAADRSTGDSAPAGRVSVHLRDGVLTVTDSGPGISEADLPHVFERFYRSSEARSRPGSGLGLAIVKHAAEQHGGMIYARNAPTGGAQFTLWLPHAATQTR